jgi:hypothetical protein
MWPLLPSPLPQRTSSITLTPDLQRSAATRQEEVREKKQQAEEEETGQQQQQQQQLWRKDLATWTHDFPRDLMMGAIMGGLAYTMVAPVERAKLLLQTQDSNMVVMDGKHPRYKGLMDCIVRIARNEGIVSLWRGNTSSILRHYPSVAINFSFKVPASSCSHPDSLSPPFSSLGALLNLEEFRRNRVVAQSA